MKKNPASHNLTLGISSKSQSLLGTRLIRSRKWFSLIGGLGLLVACGRSDLALDSSDPVNQGVGGSSGEAGAAGSSNAGQAGSAGSIAGSNQGGTSTGGVGPGGSEPGGAAGVAGVAGVAGTSGSAGTAGNAGTAGIAGSAGTAGTAGGPCQVVSDCDDLDPCTVDTCESGFCNHKGKDSDNDGFIDAACAGGTDCNDNNEAIHPNIFEICDDQIDNNCDNVFDCDDANCASTLACGCIPQAAENCGNGKDDTCDSLIDCDDPQCAASPDCVCDQFETSCFDGVDNDCDGLIDCGDPTCFGTPFCQCKSSETDCSNTADDDCDGFVDCADSECANSPECSCNQPENCSNGKDDNCDNKIDCLDPTCAASPACQCTVEETNCSDGKDNDCDGKIDCADINCSFDPNCTCNVQPENCGDGIDNNCNGLIDCADPTCQMQTACLCGGFPQPENCTDGQDNDCDGLVDCADPNCIANPACSSCLVAENCTDGIDNDCDGKIDCADEECAGKPPNCLPKSEICNNNTDDDFDGLIDCSDPDCSQNPICLQKQSNCLTAKQITASGTYTGNTTGFVSEQKGTCGGEAGEAVFYTVITTPTKFKADTIGTTFDAVLYIRAGSCESGHELTCSDDAGNSPVGWMSYAELDIPILYPGVYYFFLDGFTITFTGPDSGAYTLNIELTPNPPEICGDGIDNDGDIYVDCADSDCVNRPECKCNAPTPSGPEFGPNACTDGIDNDCDGLVDEDDIDDCKASPLYEDACNGFDENGNNIVDDFACKCASDADCSGLGFGYICYTQTTHSCAPQCEQILGMPPFGICGSVAPGSQCSSSTTGGTGQCTFP